MQAKLQAAIRTLVQFSHLSALQAEPQELLALLAESAVSQGGAAAAAVLELRPEGGWRVVAQRNAPALAEASLDLDGIGPEVSEQLLKRLNEPGLAHVQIMSLLAGGDLFGLLALFVPAPGSLLPDDLDLLSGLVDLTAATLDTAFQRRRFDAAYSELAHTRQALAHAEKLRALGQMAAGVSHDLKNVFNPLLLQLQLLRRRAEKAPEAIAPILDGMEQVIRHGLERVEKLRGFSRQSPAGELRSVVELNALLPDAIELCKLRAARPEHPVELRVVTGGLGRIFVEVHEFVGAVVNLVVNAIEAMPKGGVVTLETGVSEDGPWLRVSDTGPGIPPEMEARIFEPFFTTKGQDGTGLGLSMIYAFMQRHLGSVACTSQPGKGASFLLQFPPAPSSGYPPNGER